MSRCLCVVKLSRQIATPPTFFSDPLETWQTRFMCQYLENWNWFQNFAFKIFGNFFVNFTLGLSLWNSTQLNWPSWTVYSQVSRVFVYDIMTLNWVNCSRCESVDNSTSSWVQLRSVELSCVTINTPLVSGTAAVELFSPIGLSSFCSGTGIAWLWF